jgi:PAS domain S-box-containing protein
MLSWMACSNRDTAALDAWASHVVEAAPDAIVTTDPAGRVTQLNAAAVALFGYARDEALGRPLVDLIVPPDVEGACRTRIERVTTGAEPSMFGGRLEMRARRRDGKELPVELTVTRSSSEPPLLTTFFRDLSQLKAAEQRGSHMQRLLSSAEELAQMGSWERDLRTGRSVWSDQLYRIQGLEPGAVEPSLALVIDRLHHADRERTGRILRCVAERADAIPEEGIALDYRIVRPDGSVREIRARGRVVRDEDGTPARWVGTAHDVTEQRLTERELQAHHAVGQALRDWQRFDEGVIGLLRRLGTALEFALGSLWTWDARRGCLTCRAFWSADGVDGGDFEAATRGLALGPGEGIPGRAWQSEQPVIAGDLNADLVPSRAKAAARLGLVTGLAFPARTDDGPLAVLSYYSFDRRTLSERSVRTLTGIGRDLGRFLAQRQADLGSRQLSARELEVLRLAAGGHSGPQIAERLTVSPGTVKSHFENIYEKLGVRDRTAAVAHALRIGLIE